MIQMQISVSKRVAEKLRYKHDVTLFEVKECFLNCSKGFLEDTRLNNKTNPPTMWFIAETDRGRCLKVVFMEGVKGVEIKTA